VGEHEAQRGLARRGEVEARTREDGVGRLEAQGDAVAVGAVADRDEGDRLGDGQGQAGCDGFRR